MADGNQYIYLRRLIGMKKIDKRLKRIAFGFGGSIRKKIKKGFYQIIGKSMISNL